MSGQRGMQGRRKAGRQGKQMEVAQDKDYTKAKEKKRYQVRGDWLEC